MSSYTDFLFQLPPNRQESITMSQILSSTENVLRHFTEDKTFRTTSTDSKKPFFMGVELESKVKERVFGPSSIMQGLGRAKADLGHFVIFKQEGCCDFEIVSVPATLSFHKKNWKDYFKGEYMAEPNSDCGMHIHLDRKFMTPTEQGRLVVFMNNVDNKRFRDNIAGRAHEWARNKSVATIEKGEDISLTDKFQAINISSRNNQTTMELRICKSTYKYDLFLMRMEFADAVVHFCKATDNDHLIYTDFIAWFNKNNMKKSHPFLYKFLYKKETEYRKLLKQAA